MDFHSRCLVLAGILFTLPLPLHAQQPASAPTSQWEKFIAAAAQAGSNLAEKERLLKLAVQEAEKFGPEDDRLATNLHNLAGVYYVQGKYAEAEPLYKRALAIRKKALGPEGPDVARSLNNLERVNTN